MDIRNSYENKLCNHVNCTNVNNIELGEFELRFTIKNVEMAGKSPYTGNTWAIS
jgi:hypothetical protein